MDAKTKATLDHWMPDSQHLVIYNDSSINEDDLNVIRKAILESRKLKDFTLSGCGLNNAGMAKIVTALKKSTSVTRVNLSKNTNTKYDIFVPLVTCPNILSLEVSTGAPYELNTLDTLIREAKKADCVAELKLDKNPFSINSWDRFIYESIFDLNWKNLVSLSGMELNSGFKFHIDAFCARNKQAAEGLLSAVLSDQITSLDTVEKLNTRLPAVIYLAETQSKRQEVIQKLRAINDKALDQFGMAINVDLYVTENDLQAAGQGEAVEPLAEAVVVPDQDLPQIAEVIAVLPSYTEEDIRQWIRDGRNNPMQLLALGKDMVEAVGKIALASLAEATSSVSVEMPARSMADFSEKFEEAKLISAQNIGGELTTFLPAAGSAQKAVASSEKPSKNFFSRFLDKHFGHTAPQLRSLADAYVLSREAGQILQGMVPSITAMHDRLALQLTTELQIVQAYRMVNEQVCTIGKVATEELEAWRAEANPERLDGLVIEPFAVQCLDSAVVMMGQMSDQAKGNEARHMFQAAIKQKMREGFSYLLAQNVPIMAESMATFIGQIETRVQGSIINGLGNATKIATSTEGEANVDAVKKTIEYIDGLKVNTQEALSNMNKLSQQLADYVDPVRAVGAAAATTVKKVSAPVGNLDRG